VRNRCDEPMVHIFFRFNGVFALANAIKLSKSKGVPQFSGLQNIIRNSVFLGKPNSVVGFSGSNDQSNLPYVMTGLQVCPPHPPTPQHPRFHYYYSTSVVLELLVFSFLCFLKQVFFFLCIISVGLPKCDR
jgi:hypothetical protein